MGAGFAVRDDMHQPPGPPGEPTLHKAFNVCIELSFGDNQTVTSPQPYGDDLDFARAAPLEELTATAGLPARRLGSKVLSARGQNGDATDLSRRNDDVEQSRRLSASQHGSQVLSVGPRGGEHQPRALDPIETHDGGESLTQLKEPLVDEIPEHSQVPGLGLELIVDPTRGSVCAGGNRGRSTRPERERSYGLG